MYDYPIIVIGAGAGGLVVAIGAAKAGKKVLLIDRGVWGGDCTNFGCIPSKSLIASAHTAHALSKAPSLGIQPQSSLFDATGALDRVREIVAKVRREEEPEALKEAGVQTLEGTASFLDPHTLSVDGKKITGKNIVIATGSYPLIPPIEGLKDVPYLCNENIFKLREIPRHLVVLGGGPIGCELGQAFCRLGSKVTLVEERDALLLREDPQAQEVILNTFREEGIDVRLNCKIHRVSEQNDELCLEIDGEKICASHILVAAGRAPHLKALNLEKAGVPFEKHGISTDAYGRTKQKHIFVIGDASLHPPFTHMAEFVGRQVLTTLILPGFLKKRIDLYQPCPRCTYVDPEVAASGMSEKEAIEKYGQKRIATYTIPFDKLDRAITTGRTEGFVKVITRKWSAGILGVTVVAPRAGEMINELTLAMRNKIPFRQLASLIHPYPSYSLSIRKAADKWLTQTLLRK